VSSSPSISSDVSVVGRFQPSVSIGYSASVFITPNILCPAKICWSLACDCGTNTIDQRSTFMIHRRDRVLSGNPTIDPTLQP
jgi:hypothetical protein